jgi:DNA invertase Pin-like site-specific DNA recombinase
LDAQRTAVLDYMNGGGWKLLGELTEVETGKGRNALARRPQLRAALEACRKQKATLLIAKLDRLARNVHFVSGLMESGVEFVAVNGVAETPLIRPHDRFGSLRRFGHVRDMSAYPSTAVNWCAAVKRRNVPIADSCSAANH